jgi:hypothetical protein
MYFSYLSNNRPNDESDGDNVVNSASTIPQQNPSESKEVQSSPLRQDTNLINEGILAGQRIAKISVVTLME